MDTTKITVDTLINADIEKVWDLYTGPGHIMKWNFASDDWHCPSAENDLRPGGRYKARMEAKDGSFGFDFETIYDEVTPQKKISYTMQDGRQSTTTFEKMNGKTRVITNFDAEKQNSEELQRNGWQAILDNFRKYVENFG